MFTSQTADNVNTFLLSVCSRRRQPTTLCLLSSPFVHVADSRLRLLSHLVNLSECDRRSGLPAAVNNRCAQDATDAEPRGAGCQPSLNKGWRTAASGRVNVSLMPATREPAGTPRVLCAILIQDCWDPWLCGWFPPLWRVTSSLVNNLSGGITSLEPSKDAQGLREEATTAEGWPQER